MSTLAFISTYPAANHDLQSLWPYFRRAGFDKIVVVGPVGSRCWHPFGEADYVAIGRDSYVDGDALPRRLTDTVEHMLSHYSFDYMVACEQDVWFAKPNFPQTFPEGVMCGIRVGGQIPGCLSHFYMHWPVAASRAVWERWLPAARQLLAQGRIEIGTPDAFLALACEVAGIEPKFDCWFGVSFNTVHGLNPANPAQRDFIPAVRAAYQAGAVVVHGVKSSKVYACEALNTIREIIRP
jgi:hypothetical protein